MWLEKFQRWDKEKHYQSRYLIILSERRMGLHVLDLVKPFVPVIPEVPQPWQKVSESEKLIYVVAAAILYNLMSELPLYGAQTTMDNGDPLGWLRYATASSSGSLAELGVFPIVISACLMQIAAGKKLLKVSLDNKQDRCLFQTAQKLFAMTITVVFAFLLVLSGTYGKASEIGARSVAYLLAQIIAGGWLTILLDEIIQKGYGISSGILVFTLLKVAQSFTWTALAMQKVDMGRGPEFYGAIPNALSKLTSHSLFYAIKDAALRQNLPNMLHVTLAFVAFLGTVYIMMFRVEQPIRSTKARAASSVLPIRLLYTNGVPILFWFSCLFGAHLISVSLYRMWPSCWGVKLLGRWDLDASVPAPVSGIASFLAPVKIQAGFIRFIAGNAGYIASSVAACMFFSVAWSESSGAAPIDIARQLKENGAVIMGRRDTSALKELKKLIPLAALSGGLITGLAISAADIIGVPGVGSAMILGALNAFSMFEQLGSENITSDTIANMQAGY